MNDEMATYRFHPVSSKFWTDEKRITWSDDTTLLALYLMTCPHRTTEGIFRLPKPYIMADLGWSAERLAEPFAKLLEDRFIDYDETNNIILIRNALKYQQPANPNQETAALRAIAELPETPLLQEFQRLAERYAKRFAERFAEWFAQSPTPTPTPTPTQTPSCSDVLDDPPPQRTRKAKSNADEYPPAFEEFWSIYPRKVNKAGAFKKWQARLKEKGGPTKDQLMQAARNYRDYCQKKGTEEEYILHAATFLGPQERWRDFLEPVKAAPAKDTTPRTYLDKPSEVALLRKRMREEGQLGTVQ